MSSTKLHTVIFVCKCCCCTQTGAGQDLFDPLSLSPDVPWLWTIDPIVEPIEGFVVADRFGRNREGGVDLSPHNLAENRGMGGGDWQIETMALPVRPIEENEVRVIVATGDHVVNNATPHDGPANPAQIGNEAVLGDNDRPKHPGGNQPEETAGGIPNENSRRQ